MLYNLYRRLTSYFLQFYSPLYTLSHLTSNLGLLFFLHPSCYSFLNLSTIYSGLYPFWILTRILRCEIGDPSFFSLFDSPRMFVLSFSSSSFRSLSPLSSESLSIPIFSRSLLLLLPSVPLSPSHFGTRRSRWLSPSHRLSPLQSAIQRSRAAGGTEKRRP